MAVKARPPLGRTILGEMLALPTAPFAEHQVIAYIDRFCEQRSKLEVTRDRAGNVLVHIRQGRIAASRPVCITAHLDHPGFIAERMTGRTRVRAFWRGGVSKEYFTRSGVRFFVDGKWVRGKIRSIKTVKRDGKVVVETASIVVPGAVPAGAIGMWDIPDPTIRGTRIYARGCDDLAGAAAMLSALAQLVRRRITCDAYFLFTRAEEVGFVGAIHAARRKTIPAECVVVAMETSSELINAKMGDGPILRVGDKATTFTPEATAYCKRVAQDLTRKDKRFRFQRKLMDGGTCESSAYCTLGYDATGLCLALGNYHNMNKARRRIAPEYIDLNDYDNVVKWFVALARNPFPHISTDKTLSAKLRQLEKQYNPLLRSSRNRPC